ncbi:restriction endonuclease subunit S [Faecalibacterium prausnitzii]|uniref:restriction endonuclease subunit S n=1 Tax=Faecalibacterium prausnitzii TaxID=853 RepID=UPI0029673720|nr:restriction endonuclease subunit S [Faecalibacterium prausnitzii]MDW2998646.1 restriction endonuclease subunit S [Faecalibacterium prausnitzii]
MTGQQLKNSILQMAVQGKLVPQDPNDEPASVLLERIRAEKEQLIKEGKIKKEKNPSIIFRGADNLPYEKIGKNEPVCIADEVPFDIPESWEWVRVKHFTTLYNGRAFKPSDWTDTGLPIVRIQNLNNQNSPYNLYNGFVEPEYQLYGGELLFAWSGTPGTSFGAHIWCGKEAVLNQHIFRLDFSEKVIYKPYYMYALNQRIGELIKAAHGSAGLQHVTKGVFENTLIPIPPYKEQIRIVNKLNQLAPAFSSYSKISNSIKKLNNEFPEKLKKSILQDAVQGKLVPQDPADESASVLLERIRAEKEQLIKAGKIKRDKHESVIFRRDNSYYEISGKNEVCIDDQIPFDVPESWEWTRTGSLFQVNPRNRLPDDLDAGFMPMPLLSDGFGNHHDFQIRKWKEIKTGFTHFADGDIVIAKITPCFQNRKSAVISGLPNGFGAGTTELHVLRDHTKKLFMPYCLLIYKTHAFIEKGIKNFSGTAGQQRIGKELISDYLIPIPPLEEQKRIVSAVESIFKKLDDLLD